MLTKLFIFHHLYANDATRQEGFALYTSPAWPFSGVLNQQRRRKKEAHSGLVILLMILKDTPNNPV